MSFLVNFQGPFAADLEAYQLLGLRGSHTDQKSPVEFEMNLCEMRTDNQQPQKILICTLQWTCSHPRIKLDLQAAAPGFGH